MRSAAGGIRRSSGSDGARRAARWRLSATLAIAVVGAGCAGSAVGTDAPTASRNVSALPTPSGSHETTTPEPTITITESTITESSSPPSTVEPARPRIDEASRGAAGCRSIDIVVFGNSIEMSAGATPHDRQHVWHAVLDRSLELQPELGDIRVDNQSAFGTTMTLPNYFGPDDHLRMITHIPNVFDDVDPLRRSCTIALVNPSIIELLFNGGDVDRAVESTRQTVAMLDGLGIEATLVFPMHPQAKGTDDELSRLIAEFNAALAEDGITEPSLTTSPLLDASAVFGSDEYYDDFKTDLPEDVVDRGDGVHPDREGHQQLAAGFAPLVLEQIRLLAQG